MSVDDHRTRAEMALRVAVSVMCLWPMQSWKVLDQASALNGPLIDMLRSAVAKPIRFDRGERPKDWHVRICDAAIVVAQLDTVSAAIVLQVAAGATVSSAAGSVGVPVRTATRLHERALVFAGGIYAARDAHRAAGAVV